MRHQMRAEYGPAGLSGEVKTWHIVPEDGTVALCGRALDRAAATRDATLWTTDPQRHCHTCGAMVLRQTPYLPDEHE